MALPGLMLREGKFWRAGKVFIPFGPVYFGRKPGTCSGDYFSDRFWPETRKHLECDFSRMVEIGCTWVIPFINCRPFWQRGRQVAKVWDRLDLMVEIARRCGLYCVPFPNLAQEHFADLMGKPYRDDPDHPHKHPATNPQIHEATVRLTAAVAERYRRDAAVPIIMTRGGGRLWTGYCGYAPGEPETRELLTAKKPFQEWLRQRYRDDFAAFLRSHPRLPEKPRAWSEVALPVEVEGQFTEYDSRTFDFLAFSAEVSAKNQLLHQREVKARAPDKIMMYPFEGCEWERGPMEVLLPGIAELDAIWTEMYQFGMTHGSHTHPDWERKYFYEPVTGKRSRDCLSTISEAWERARYLKSAAPRTAMVYCHGTVMDNLIRWTPNTSDQRIIFERLHRLYLEAGAAGIGFWCWSDDETSSRPEPKFHYREGEAMGIIDYRGEWRPVARRAALYARAAAPAQPRVSRDVLLLLPTPHMMGLDRIDGLTTVACLTSALGRLGIAPEVKYTYWQGRGAIPLNELSPFKLVILACDEYRKDLVEIPAILRRYVSHGGRLLMPLGEPDSILSPTLERIASDDLAALTGRPKVLHALHQHDQAWNKSVRWRLTESCLPYWDNRRGRWMPGRGEKRLVYKTLTLGKGAEVLAEACVPPPRKADGSCLLYTSPSPRDS